MSGAFNQAGRTSRTSKQNQDGFQFDQFMSRVWTAIPVKVISCTGTGAVATAGTVNVQPLVNMIDGAGNATPHGVINGLPYYRLQAGNTAIIADPIAGDLGLAIFCQRDISSVKVNKAVSNPGSFRKFDPADGIYLGGLLNPVPAVAIQFGGGAIIINGALTTTSNLVAGNGATGSFTTGTGNIVTVQDGIITNIY